MDRDEALKLLKGGEKGSRAWNEYHFEGGDCPSLTGADLTGANLSGAHLYGGRE